MEEICIRYFQGGHVSDDDEEEIVDFLQSKKIKVKLNMDVNMLCALAMTHLHGPDFMRVVNP